TPPEWNLAPYNAQRTTLSTWETYYETKGMEASRDSAAALRITDPVNGPNVGTVVVGAVHEDCAAYPELSWTWMLRAFLSTGWPLKNDDGTEKPGRTPEVPYVVISTPAYKLNYDNPTTVPVRWAALWQRWDGGNYTSVYPTGFNDDLTPLKFLVMYSTAG